MKNKLKDFFNYSSSERKGSIALIVLLALALYGYWLIDVFKSSSKVEYVNLSEEIKSLTKIDNSLHQEVKEIQYFEFNPNEINEESMGSLMAESIIETIAACIYFDVNPFDQPAVEQGKILTKKYLI